MTGTQLACSYRVMQYYVSNKLNLPWFLFGDIYFRDVWYWCLDTVSLCMFCRGNFSSGISSECIRISRKVWNKYFLGRVSGGP